MRRSAENVAHRRCEPHSELQPPTRVEHRIVLRFSVRTSQPCVASSPTRNNGGVVLYRYYRIRAYAALPSQVVASTDAYIPLREAVFYARTSKNINAFNAFLTWIKVFKYLHFIPRFRILLGTVEFAASKIGVFFVICAVVLFGSAQGFALAFGTNISAYRNLTQSFFTLTRSLLGYVRQTEECVWSCSALRGLLCTQRLRLRGVAARKPIPGAHDVLLVYPTRWVGVRLAPLGTTVEKL